MIDNESLQSLERLHKLKEDGVITAEDFEKAKLRLLEGPAKRTPKAAVLTSSDGHSLKDKFDGTLPPEQNVFAWMILPLRRYADFTGRSCRKEFWMFALLHAVVILGAAIIIAADTNYLGMTGGIGNIFIVLIAVLMLGTLVPTFAVQARRFHDQDRSGWFVLLNLIPYIGVFIVFVFMLIKGDENENRFGPEPL